MDADGALPDLLGAKGLPLIDAGVGGFGTSGGHLPEGVLDDAWGVMFIAHHFLEAACRY